MRVRTVCALLACAALAAGQPPVLVIALDGFRHDYARRDGAEALLALEREGASVRAWSPAFPSTTFPNFHSMATGLRPARHGIVAMVFRDRETGRGFSYMRNAAEGFWYGGRPIWEVAEEQGVLSAAYFWPGTEAGVNGRYPSYFKRYDPRAAHEERIGQVLDWFRLPESERPGLAIVYFADVDSMGHAHGPDSPQVNDAVRRVDAAVGEIVRGVRALRAGVNILVVSDHGMSAVDQVIDFTGDADLSGCKAANEAPMTMLYCEEPERVRAELLARERAYTVERRGELAAHLEYEGNARIGDLIVRPKGKSIVYALPPGDAEAAAVPALKGMHGYDPASNPEMLGILIGAGPAFRPGARVEEARTVDLYPLLGKLLGLKLPEEVDGKFSRVRELLRESGR